MPKTIFRIIGGILIVLIVSSVVVFSQEKQEPVEILFYYTSHCHACHDVMTLTLPWLREKYKHKIKIIELDFDKAENFIRLLGLQEQYDYHPKKELVPTIFIDGRFLVGSNDINKYLELYIDTALSEKGDRSIPKVGSSVDIVGRFKHFSPLAVFAAGLIDGINPCAFTAIIFFISFLTLQGYGRREVLAIGLSFILAVFITYILIGLGLFSFIYKLKMYWFVVRIIYSAAAVLCFVLAGLAFYDFIKFRRTGRTQELILQLPASLKEKIQRVIARFYRKNKIAGVSSQRDFFGLICSAFVVGCLVSLFEAVCTGQVYLPTIVFVLKSTHLRFQAFSYLLLYNLMFVFPLWMILLFALWGTDSQQFSRFVHKHMGLIKILMAVLFLGLGLLLIWS